MFFNRNNYQPLPGFIGNGQQFSLRGIESNQTLLAPVILADYIMIIKALMLKLGMFNTIEKEDHI
ncbi:hypothetical protein C1T21_13125 [Paenibacillus sp. F4]|nr:hypothetical protein C1T21_13125 [Paenibacillus sp. F4]